MLIQHGYAEYGETMAPISDVDMRSIFTYVMSSLMTFAGSTPVSF